jgi:hypothetical protein
MSTSVVDRLSNGLEPQRPYWSPAPRFAAWIAVVLLVVGVAMAVYGVRPDAGERLRHPGFVIELALIVAVGVASALLACRAAVPGLQPRRGLSGVVASIAVAILATALMPEATFVWAMPGGDACAARTLLIAAIPWLGLATFVVRGAALDPLAAGLLAGVGPLALSAAAMRVICRSDDTMHVLVWHDLPAALGVIVSIGIGVAFLGRWSRRRV